MGRPRRSDQFRHDEIAIVHCVQRCVRIACIAGVDEVSGNDYSFRREWIRRRLESLASVFAIDVLTYAILSNHLHVILRSRPDVLAKLSDEEVAIRWWRVFPGHRIKDRKNSGPSLQRRPHRSGHVANVRSEEKTPCFFLNQPDSAQSSFHRSYVAVNEPLKPTPGPQKSNGWHKIVDNLHDSRLFDRLCSNLWGWFVDKTISVFQLFSTLTGTLRIAVD